MNLSNIIATVIQLSARSDLPKPIVEGYLNWHKLSMQRQRRWPFNLKLASYNIVANFRSQAIPTDFLFIDYLRRRSTNKTLTRYDKLEAFEIDYPQYENNGATEVKSTPEAYVLYGRNFIFGSVPKENETVNISYYAKLADYSIGVVEQDFLTDFFYDGLTQVALSEVFTSWIVDANKAQFWMEKANQSYQSFEKMFNIQDASFDTNLGLSIKKYQGRI